MDKKDVPYIVYEGAEARAERHIKRLIVALVLTVLMLFASNAFGFTSVRNMIIVPRKLPQRWSINKMGKGLTLLQELGIVLHYTRPYKPRVTTNL